MLIAVFLVEWKKVIFWMIGLFYEDYLFNIDSYFSYQIVYMFILIFSAIGTI